MGREIRRVPIDFDWPLEKVWPGFVNPFFDSDSMSGNVSAAQQTAYDAWEQMPPPDGDGYQLWETVTNGSPVSPVDARP